MGNTADDIVGINLQRVYGGSVVNNDISLSPSTLYTQYGIEACNGQKLVISENTILGGSTSSAIDPARACGINVVVCPFSTVSCNTVDNIDTGIRYAGNCDGNTIRENSLNQHRNALMYWAEMTITGVQDNTSNVWLDNAPLAEEALWINFDINQPVDPFGPLISASRYLIAGSGILFPDPVNPDQNWFIADGNPIASSKCFDSNEDNDLEPFTIAENWMMAGQFPVDLSKPAIEWDARYQLYGRLFRHPEWLSNPLAAQFFNNLANSEIAALYQLEHELANMYMENGLSANQLLSMAQAVVPSTNIGGNLKNALVVFLEKLSSGAEDYTTVQLNILEGLAWLCPYVDGRAVQVSRSLLNLPFLLENDLCNLESERSTGLGEIMNPSALSLSPNPGNDLVKLTVSNEHDSKMHYFVYDPTGSLKKVQEFVGNAVFINTNDWSSGLYTIQVKDANHKLISVDKLIKK